MGKADNVTVQNSKFVMVGANSKAMNLFGEGKQSTPSPLPDSHVEQKADT